MIKQKRTFHPENRMIRIEDGSTISEFVYDANGSRVLKSVSSNGTRERTAYIGSHYEEELTGSANPPYINYYSLGGKMVGMRRANQASMNGQYRMVTDHLGSASLLVDLNGGSGGIPAVVQRQYFRAYGQTAYTWSSGGSLTEIGYTGQRAEGSTGLIFYNARFYDAALGYFASADTIGVDQGASQSRNRYAYVLNNPIRYNDPSGHCTDDPKDVEEGKPSCASTVAEFKRYGIDVKNLGAWDLEELLKVLERIKYMITKAGWSIDDFKEAMGPIVIERVRTWHPKYDAEANLNVITFYDGAFYNKDTAGNYTEKTDNQVGRIVTHELAHVWDFHHMWIHSAAMAGVTGGSIFARGPGAASNYGNSAPWEDFAEAVAAYFYPSEYPDTDPAYDRDDVGFAKRMAYVNWALEQEKTSLPRPQYPHR